MSGETLTQFLQQESDTVAAGERLGRVCSSGAAIIFLQGDLGSGKTTFTRGVLRAFGHHGPVKSPTYTLVEPYELAGGRSLFHFDLYRLGDPEELEYMGIRDYFGSDHLCLIEWPERGAGFLPEADLLVSLTPQASAAGMPGRALSLLVQSQRGQAILSQFKKAG